MISIKEITHENQQDINISNQPFPLIGRLIPSYQNQAWSNHAVLFEPTEWVTFPNENYDFDQIQDSHIFIGAYDDNKCVGFASMLIDKTKEIAQSNGYQGIYTIAQDNNLIACQFYQKVGFEIGGLDTRGYKGTAQEGKADIYFYLDCD
ncbi:GNAT family N-acetyltransferase [Streptococcus suis]|uniref:GNAT family N-acetyltransferase n=1 Tax=Streptococcus suis TaxID=1307 RepID=UPI001478C104